MARLKLNSLVPLVFGILLFGCKEESRIYPDFEESFIYADFENIDDEEAILSDNKTRIKVFNQISSHYSLSGFNSLLLSRETGECGINLVDNARFGETFRVSIWKKNNDLASLHVKSKSSESVVTIPILMKEGWHLITTSHKIIDRLTDSLLIFIQSEDSNYFDDFYCEKINDTITGINQPKNRLKTIKFNIDRDNYGSIKAFRDTAFANGIITKKEKKWIKATMQKTAIKLRLKGDWTDHLVGSKWGFRIKANDDSVFQNKSFSLMRPECRNYLSEWIYHRMLLKEQIATTEYEFVNIWINNIPLGAMAIEDHFTDDLLLKNKLENGYLLKFDEEKLWNSRAQKNDRHPGLFEAEIKHFRSQHVDSITLANAYKALDDFRNSLRPISELFDLAHTAKVFAISDVNNAYHGFNWHNMRFYYNPKTDKLSFVPYDGNGEIEIADSLLKLFDLGHAMAVEFNKQFFRDSIFKKLYHDELRFYSSKVYMDTFFDEISGELQGLENVMKGEFNLYYFDKRSYMTRVRRIRNYLSDGFGPEESRFEP